MFVGKEQVWAALGDPALSSSTRCRRSCIAARPQPLWSSGPGSGQCECSRGTLLDSKTKAFVPLAEARATFEAAGINKSKGVICYYGGGISATVDLFMLYQLGYRITLYDGSMGEWAKDHSLPIETD